MPKRMTMTEVLRDRLVREIDSGVTFRAIERASGVLRQSLMKFARSEASLRLDLADKLADYFELELKPRSERKGK